MLRRFLNNGLNVDLRDYDGETSRRSLRIIHCDQTNQAVSYDLDNPCFLCGPVPHSPVNMSFALKALTSRMILCRTVHTKFPLMTDTTELGIRSRVTRLGNSWTIDINICLPILPLPHVEPIAIKPMLFMPPISPVPFMLLLILFIKPNRICSDTVSKRSTAATCCIEWRNELHNAFI